MIRTPEARPTITTPNPVSKVGHAALPIPLLKLSKAAPHKTGPTTRAAATTTTISPTRISRPVIWIAACRELFAAIPGVLARYPGKIPALQRELSHQQGRFTSFGPGESQDQV